MMPFHFSEVLRPCKCLFALATVVAFAGCGGAPSDQPELGTVHGIVTLEGEPLEGAVVEFRPPSGRPSSGMTDASGQYELEYTDKVDGAIVGPHTVHISTQQYVVQEDGSTKESPERVPANYNLQSELKADVAAGDNELDFPLTK